MKILIYKIYLIAFVSFWFQNTKAQDPNWSVNTADYQYSMTFTAFLNVDGTTLTASNDKVAAFVGGEIRGVANVVYVSSANKYVVYLSVYANTNNETIRFKIYNSGTNSIVNIDKTEAFSIDEHKGGVFQSYSIASPVLGNNALFNSFEFEGITAASEEISSDKINIVVPENTDLTALTSVFSASQNAKVFVAGVLQVSGNGVKDFTNPVIYNVLSEDEAIYKEYEVSVSVALNNDPVTVAISSAVNLNTNTIPVSLDIVFSKVVSGFVVSDFILENTAIIALTTSDFKTYKVEVVPLSQGEFSVQIPANSALDENNNQNQISNKIIFTYDITKPIITDISIDNDANSLGFLVTFSEDVLNVGVSDFELKGMGSNNVAVSSINLIANNQYKVAVSNTNSDEGAISLQLKNTSDIKDFSENAIVISEYESYFLSKKEITITADSKTKLYGAVDPAFTYQITSGSLDAGDVLTGGLTRVLGEDVGEYAISSTLLNENYAITFVAAKLIITQKEITITADTKTKLYGAVDPAFTYQITSGSLEAGDVLTGGLTRVLGEDVGEYAISSTLSNDNYAITFVAAKLSITQKEITITADTKTKLYGAVDPAFTYQITSGSLEAGDVLTGGLTRVLGEDVGEYAISSTLSNDNYAITFVPATLGITQKEITITADTKTKLYGEVDPEFTYQITSGSLINNDVFSGNLTREIGEEIGVYLIQLGSLTLGANYNITFVEANFEITTSLSNIDRDQFQNIKLYPNPIKNFLNIETGNQLIINEIVIYSILGKVLLKDKSMNQRIKLQHLTRGFYLIKIITDQGVLLKRILKI